MKKFFLLLIYIFFVFQLSAQTQLDNLKSDSKASFESDFAGTVQLAMSNADYMVTAGDVYSLNYAAGNNVVSYTIPVDPSYKIRVSNLAVLDAAGKSYITLKKQVEEIVSKNYPMSGVQFVLLNPASFKVIITGEVISTTERNAWALTRLSSVIKDLTTSYSSTRNIEIISKNGSSKIYDLFLAIRDGDLKQDPYLRPGDVININRIDRLVTVSGSVERPGTYELLKGENLSELIYKYGHGLNPLADISRIELSRSINSNDAAGNKIYLNKESIEANYSLENFDSVYIYSFKSLMPVVFVEGAIRISEESTELEASNRIPFTFQDGENYAYFVRRIKNFISIITDTDNAYIIRGENHIPLNITTMLYDANYYSTEVLQANDVLMLPFKQNFVSVAGSVNNPGRYPYIPNRTYEYYIGLAGGFKKSENAFNSIKISDINGVKLSKDSMITPECTITAKTNSFLYYFNQYAPIITTALSVVTTGISIQMLVNKD